MNDLSNKYFVRRSPSASWEDLTGKFYGLRILKVDGLYGVGDAVNVYQAKWADSQTEDIMVTKQDEHGNDVIIRENVDITVTYIISRRYTNQLINEENTYKKMIDYFCNEGSFYIKSAYANRQAKVICLKGAAPTTQKLNRGDKSYIMGTITLHCIDAITYA